MAYKKEGNKWDHFCGTFDSFFCKKRSTGGPGYAWICFSRF